MISSPRGVRGGRATGPRPRPPGRRPRPRPAGRPRPRCRRRRRGVRPRAEVLVAVRRRLQPRGLQPSGRLDGGGGVDEAEAAGVVAALGGGVAGGVLQDGLDLGRGEAGVGRLHQGGGPGDEGGGGAGAPALVVAVVRIGDDHVDAGGADRGVPAAGGEGGAGAVAVDGGRGDHARVGGRVGDVVALLAAVPGRGDDDHALPEGVLDGLVLGGLRVGGGGVVAQGEVDDVGAVVGGPADAFGQGVAAGLAGLGAGGVAVLQDHAQGEDLGLRGDAHDAFGVSGAVSVTGDDPGHGGAVPGPGAVALARAEADQVLAGEDVAGEVGVVGLDAGVQDGDGDARALGGAPRLLGVHGVQGPLLGADAVGVRGGGRDEDEGGGEEEAQGPRPAAEVCGGHDGCSVGAPTCLRRARSTRSARPCASWPRPAWAGADAAPDSMASSAGSGSSTVRPSDQPDTA
ncbi:hypothetical protein STENM36S_08808 [Streptomyces tendae]